MNATCVPRTVGSPSQLRGRSTYRAAHPVASSRSAQLTVVVRARAKKSPSPPRRSTQDGQFPKTQMQQLAAKLAGASSFFSPMIDIMGPATNNITPARDLSPSRRSSQASKSPERKRAEDSLSSALTASSPASASGDNSCCMGLDFAQTLKYIEATACAPGVIRISHPEQLTALRSLCVRQGLVLVSTLHCGSAADAQTKPALAAYHRDLDAYYAQQLATARAIFVKARIDTPEAVGVISHAWRQYRLCDGTLLTRSPVTTAECGLTGVCLIAESMRLSEIRQCVSDVLFRSDASMMSTAETSLEEEAEVVEAKTYA